MGAVMKMDGTPLDQRKLPHNVDAEQMVIGALLNENDWLSKIGQNLSAADFYEPIHGAIYETLVSLIEAGHAASPISMKPYVAEMQIPDMAPFDYLMRLWNAAPKRIADAIEYTKIVKNDSITRSIYLVFEEEMADILAGKPMAAVKRLERVETVINDLRPPLSAQSGFERFEVAAERAVDIAARAYSRGGVLAGLSTGLQRLDDALGGLHRSDMVILAGATGSGKSALAINISYAVARGLMERAAAGEKPGVVGFFSLEMPSDQIAQRILAEHSRVSGWRLRKGFVSETEFSSFSDSAYTLRSLPIEIDATAGLTITQLMMRARGLKKRRGIDLVVVDYLQLLKGSSGRKDTSRHLEIAEITGGLKALAKELDCPVVGLSQVSRDIGKREDKRPMLSDLRECVTGDTRLICADTGRMIPIAQVQKGMRVIGLGPNLKTAIGRVADRWSTGTKPVFRVTTKSGRTIRATANHPFLTDKGWVPLADLKPESLLAVPYRVCQHGAAEGDRAELCRLLGYMAGNGAMQEHRTMGLIIPDQTAFDDACSIIMGNWPEVQIKVKAGGYNDAWISRTFANGHGAPFGNPMREWLRSVGMIGTRDRTKHVPDFVFEAGLVGAQQFIAGYLETDGCVKNDEDRWTIQFDTTSPQLAQDMMALLSKIGVASFCGPPSLNTFSTTPLYRVMVAQSAHNLRRFAEQIPAKGARGRRLAAMLKEMPDKATRQSIFMLPAGIATYAAANHNFKDQSKRLSREKALQLLADRPDPVLETYCGSDVIWDRVREIAPVGEEEVFDVSVPGLNCFVGDGIVVHNSGSIEMDADVVLFVYRDEYYLKKSEPKPGTEAHAEWTSAMERAHGRADIIIAKNRHGPEDTIKVGFDATLTQFKDELPDDVGPPASRLKADRPKKLTLIKEATVALGILKNLLITQSIENDGHVDKAAKGAKLVSYTLWREKCAEELLDTDRGEKAAGTLMEKVVKDLRAPSSGHPPLIGRGGSKDSPYVWLIESKS